MAQVQWPDISCMSILYCNVMTKSQLLPGAAGCASNVPNNLIYLLASNKTITYVQNIFRLDKIYSAYLCSYTAVALTHDT